MKINGYELYNMLSGPVGESVKVASYDGVKDIDVHISIDKNSKNIGISSSITLKGDTYIKEE